MENTHSTFLVLKIREDKSNGKTEITVDKGFDSLVDAKRYKDAKDLIERLTPSEYCTNVSIPRIKKIRIKTLANLNGKSLFKLKIIAEAKANNPNLK